MRHMTAVFPLMQVHGKGHEGIGIRQNLDMILLGSLAAKSHYHAGKCTL